MIRREYDTMENQSIILYAKILKKVFPYQNVIEIAKILSYNVAFLDSDLKFLIANTYRYNNGKKAILINSRYNDKSRNILCAHELGHAILDHPAKSNYKDKNLNHEYQANLFAVSLLFNEEDFNIPFIHMSNYVLQTILDINIEIKLN